MKPEIILIRAYGIDEGFKTLPFGILDITSYLEKFGFGVEIIDRHNHKTSFLSILRNIAHRNPRYVGISAMTHQAEDALKLGRYIRRHLKIPLIYGGLHFTIFPEEGLDTGDIVVRGEGENAVLEILNNRINGKRIYTSQQIVDLDSIPLPNENLIKMLAWDHSSTSLLTSRGCPYNCHFCLDKKYRDTHMRYHSIEYALDFIELVKRSLRINDFFISDDIFTVNEKRVFDFCNGILKRKINIKLGCFSRSGIDNIEMYRIMKKAGFYNILIGAESGNNNVLQAINKQQTVEEVRKTIEIIKKAGLDASATFMVGNITETEKTIKDTINFAKELSLSRWYVGYAQPYPGSRFYEIAKEHGTLINKDVKSYRNNKISFVPYGLSYSKLKKLYKEFIRALIPKKTLLRRILDKIGFLNKKMLFREFI